MSMRLERRARYSERRRPAQICAPRSLRPGARLRKAWLPAFDLKNGGTASDCRPYDQDHRRHPAASDGDVFGVPGASCGGLDRLAGVVFSQSAARFDRRPAVRPRMATGLRQAAAVALVDAGSDLSVVRTRSVLL